MVRQGKGPKHREVPIGECACRWIDSAMASYMLEAGGNLRYIQAMLGHSELSITEICTQVLIGKLKEIHSAIHSANMGRISETGPSPPPGSPPPRGSPSPPRST